MPRKPYIPPGMRTVTAVSLYEKTAVSRYDQLKAEAIARDSRRRTPDEEHHLQAACVTWFRLQFPKHRHNLFAVPNGGMRQKATSGRLKAEGVLPGVADLILLLPGAGYHALLIEMKTRTGRQSPDQRAWQSLIEADGYRYVICRSLDDFIREVNDYLQL